MGISNLSFSATNINVGLDADKSATPIAGDMYLATDTEFLYKCYTDGSWVSDELTEAKIDTVKPNICLSNQGSYSGDSSVNRAIPHGLGVVPVHIRLVRSNNPTLELNIQKSGIITQLSSTGGNEYAVTAADATNFYVGNAAEYGKSANLTGETIEWVART